MNPNFQYTKQCSRCPLVVRMTRAQFEKEKDQAETTCDRCRAILTAEADEVLKNLSKEPQAPASPANPT
jgi:hypothetical protein